MVGKKATGREKAFAETAGLFGVVKKRESIWWENEEDYFLPRSVNSQQPPVNVLVS